MTNRFSNPLHLLGSPKPGIYRPRYKARLENPSYALDAPMVRPEPAIPGLLESLQALEEWNMQEGAGKALTVRWRPEKMGNLAVYINPLPNSRWPELLWRACQEWELATAGLVRFTRSVRPSQADIRVEWSDNAVEGRDFEVGHTHRSVQAPHWIVQATITLLKEPLIDKTLSAEQVQQRLYTTALHEAGHALGLEHSSSSKDVMHHRGWRNRQLSANDIRQLQDLYANASSSVQCWT